MIYIIVLLLALMGVYAYDIRGNRRFYAFSYWGLLVIFVLIAGFRYRIGTDSIVYENYYENVPAFWELGNFKFDSTRFEPGFMIFASLTRGFSSDFMWLQFTESIAINLVIFWFILKNAKHRFLAVTLYYLFLYLNLNTQVMREALAVAFFLLAWPYLRDGKWIKYYCLDALACLMHTSAFFTLLIPLFCLPGIRNAFKYGRRTIIICVAMFVIGIIIQARFSAFFTFLAVTQRMMDRVNEYSQDVLSGYTLNIVGILGSLIQYCIYPLIAVWLAQKNQRFKILHERREESQINNNETLGVKSSETQVIASLKKEQRDFDRWQMMVLLGVYLMIFSIPISIFTRYFNYFGIFCLVAVANMAYSKITVKEGKKVRISNIAWTLILTPLFFFSLYSYTSPATKSGTLKTYQIFHPYYSRLNPRLDNDREAIYRYWGAR